MSDKEGFIILGASGLVGRYFYNLLKSRGRKVFGTSFSSYQRDLIPFDMVRDSIERLPIGDIKYLTICSAVTKIDRCKADPEYSRKVNVESIERIIVEACRLKKFPVFLSSASVFDGTKGGYKEEDIPNPLSLYGSQKLEVENFIKSNIEEYLILRPGKIFGVNRNEGVLFTHWLEKYKKGEEILLANDEKLAPQFSGDVGRAILSLTDLDANGVFHISPPLAMSRLEMANRFFDYLGVKDAKIKSCSIEDFNSVDTRAKNTYLDSSKFINSTGFNFTSLEDCFERISPLLESI